MWKIIIPQYLIHIVLVSSNFMDLPINDAELETIVFWLSFTENSELYEKLKLVKSVREEHPNGPYKKILREEHGMVI